MNTEILDEYEEIFSQKTKPEVAKNVVEAIARLHTTVYQEIYVHFGLIYEDEDDNKFVDCAVSANASYIVTNDKHYNVLKNLPWPKISVVNINEFMNLLNRTD